MSVRSKPSSEIEVSAEPEQSELPEGWAVAKLHDIGKWCSGGTPSRTKAEYFGTGIRWVKSGDLPDGPITKTDEQITQLGLDNSAAKLMPPGTICMALYGATIGKLGTMTFEAATNQATANLIPDERLVDGQYVFYYLMSERQNFIDLGQGGAQPNISQEIVRNHPIKLAPLAEQRRIVAKLELLLGKVSSSQQRLSRVPGLLKRFRQSVLAAACSGKLTADWREENDCVESASDLIARLGSERRERYRELCVAAKNAKRGKPQEFDNIEPSVRTDLDTFDLPSDWSWVDLRFVMTVDEPFCYGVVQPGANEPNGNLLVRAGDLQNGTVNLSELRRIPADIDAEYERSRLKGGELLVTVVGAGIGTVAIAPAYCAGFNIARAVAKVPIRDVSAEYVFQWFNTSKALSWMVGDAREVARPTLNLEQLRTIPVPLPPLSEQQEIVRRVEKLFAFADQIEARLRQAQTHVDRLTQSLLAKAFRGELVPTEHALAAAQGRDYESAAQLLERVRTANTSSGPTPSQTRRRRAARTNNS